MFKRWETEILLSMRSFASNIIFPFGASLLCYSFQIQAIFIAFESGGNLGIRIIFLTFWNSDFDSEILFKNIFLDFCAILSNSGCFARSSYISTMMTVGISCLGITIFCPWDQWS